MRRVAASVLLPLLVAGGCTALFPFEGDAPAPCRRVGEPRCDCGGTSILADDFEAGSWSPRWAPDEAVTLSAGAVRLEGASGLRSRLAHDLRGDAVAIEVADVRNEGDGLIQLWVGRGESAFVSMEVNESRLLGHLNDGGLQTVVDLEYDPATHRWWRIREQDGFLHFETSSDSETWSDHQSFLTPDFAAVVYVAVASWTAGGDYGASIGALRGGGRSTADCPISALQEPFEGRPGVRQWDDLSGDACPAEESGGVLVLSSVPGCQSGWTTPVGFVLEGGVLDVEVLDLPEGAGGIGRLVVARDGDHYLAIYGQDGLVRFSRAAGGPATDIGSPVGWGPDLHHWRISQLDGRIRIETSAGGRARELRAEIESPFGASPVVVTLDAVEGGVMRVVSVSGSTL